jgi:triphosphoribosyl-dephospho-CoA synthetase
MSSNERVDSPALEQNPHAQAGWEAALRELQHQAAHLEARGAVRGAVTLYDAIRIARAGGLTCEEHAAG